MKALLLATLLLAATAGAAPGKRPAGTGHVNLNTASAEQLDALPGISPAAAKAIVSHREKQPFGRPEDLLKVKGFARKRFERLRPYLATTGTTTFQRTAPRAGRRPHGPMLPHR